MFVESLRTCACNAMTFDPNQSASDGTREERQNGWTRKQQQTTTLSEPTSVDIDAIDSDTNARAGDAELTPWLLVLDCAPQLSFMRDTEAGCCHDGGLLLWSSGSRWC